MSFEIGQMNLIKSNVELLISSGDDVNEWSSMVEELQWTHCRRQLWNGDGIHLTALHLNGLHVTFFCCPV